MRHLPYALLTAAVTLAFASPAGAASFPKEIRGTIGGFDQEQLRTTWQGSLILTRQLVDPHTGFPPSQPSYLPAPGTAVAWQSRSVLPGCTGEASGTVTVEQLTGGLVIEPEPEPAVGHAWALTLGPKSSAPMEVSGTCVDQSGNETQFKQNAGSGVTFGYNSYDATGMNSANYHSPDPGAFEEVGQATGEFGNQGWDWNLRAVGGLKAVPIVAATTRGKTATLDGSQSIVAAEITSYLWEFEEVAGACPHGAPPNAGATRTGSRATIVALCDLKVTLTVANAAGDTHTASTALTVRPRKGTPWRTPLNHRENNKVNHPERPTEEPNARSFGGGHVELKMFGGINVSDCGEPSPASIILCPKLKGGRSWLDKGYKLKRVSDPGGPFDAQFYVHAPSLHVKRLAMLNPSILKGSEFYARNSKLGLNVAGFVKAVSDHEGLGTGKDHTGHSGIIKKLLKRDATNPRRAIEAVFGPAKPAVADAADTRLRKVDRILDEESADPLDVIWKGTLEVFDHYRKEWYRLPGIEVPGKDASRG